MAIWHRYTENAHDSGGYVNLDFVTRICVLPLGTSPETYGIAAYVVDAPDPEALSTTQYASVADAETALQSIIARPYES